MKNQHFFFLLVGLLCNVSVIQAKNVNVPQDLDSKQIQESSFSSTITVEPSLSLDQSSSPMMMFNDDEEPVR